MASRTIRTDFRWHLDDVVANSLRSLIAALSFLICDGDYDTGYNHVFITMPRKRENIATLDENQHQRKSNCHYIYFTMISTMIFHHDL